MFLIFLIILINFIIISDFSKTRNTTSFLIIFFNAKQFLLVFKRVVIETSTLIILDALSTESPPLFFCIILVTAEFMIFCILYCFKITSIHIITYCFFTWFFILLIIILFIKQIIILLSLLTFFLTNHHVFIILFPQIKINLWNLIILIFLIWS